MEFDEDDPIRYDRWIEDALRGVIRQALAFTAENGLVGEHHFYVTFRTDTGVVELPDYLKAQHPNEMTIVLQHQYESLVVEDDRFYVTLRFNGQAVTLNIPFEEITGFTDPSVNFGLQLKTTEIDEEELGDYDYPFEPPAEEQDRAEDGPVVERIPSAESADVVTVTMETDASDNDTASNTGDDDSADEEEPRTGEVIALDAFRKK